MLIRIIQSLFWVTSAAGECRFRVLTSVFRTFWYCIFQKCIIISPM
jgi:hypothetical protein